MKADGPLSGRLALIAITDPAAAAGLVEAALAAVRGGAPTIQLRSKEASTAELLSLAVLLREATREAGALLIINDRIDIALACGADGAHLGDDDLPLEAARRIVPDSFVLGKSVDTVEEARRAERAGADYLGVGPIFQTGTKLDTGPVLGTSCLADFRSAVSLPFVGIGGISRENAASVLAAGADGVAAVSAITAHPDPEAATRELIRAISKR